MGLTGDLLVDLSEGTGAWHRGIMKEREKDRERETERERVEDGRV